MYCSYGRKRLEGSRFWTTLVLRSRFCLQIEIVFVYLAIVSQTSARWKLLAICNIRFWGGWIRNVRTGLYTTQKNQHFRWCSISFFPFFLTGYHFIFCQKSWISRAKISTGAPLAEHNRRKTDWRNNQQLSKVNDVNNLVLWIKIAY